MKKCNGYLTKSYVFNYRNEIIITYSELLNKIKDGLYINYRFCPPEKQIKIISVEEWDIIDSDKHIEVYFALIDTRGKGLKPKIYYLDFFTGYIEVSKT